MRVLSIDIGASSGRLIVVNYDKENGFSSQETFRFSNGMNLIEGHLRWDFNQLMESIYRGLNLTFKIYKDIKSIGVDTWGVDYGILNRKGELMSLPIGYRDSRCKNAASNLLKKIDYSYIYKRSGIQFLNFNTLFQLYDDKVINNLDYETFLLIPDLINYFLTGNRFLELTNLSTTGLYNPVKKEIDEELLALCNFDHTKIPKIISPSKKVGSLKKDIIEKYELYPCDVISVGSHDTASAIASLSLNENMAYLSSGTWSLLGVELDKPLINDETYEANFTNEIGLEHRVRFLKNIMGLFIIQELRKDFLKENPNITFGDIHNEAMKILNNTTYIDVNAPDFQEPGNMLEKYNSYLKKTNQYKEMTIGEIARSIYESMAFKYFEEFHKLEKIIGKRITSIRVMGGGVNATLLNQLIANVLNINVYLGLSEATVFGNALAQLIYLKSFNDLNEARAGLKRFTPETIYKPKNVELYRCKYIDYKKVMEINKV